MTNKEFIYNFKKSLESDSRSFDINLSDLFPGDLLPDCSLQTKMYEEIELNLMPENPEINSETNIDWNFVLGLFFGIGYLIFGV